MLADVLVRDPHPPVTLGGGDHALNQPAAGLLGVGSTGEFGLRLADAGRQRVANPLELGHAQNPRTAGGADPPLDSLAREGRGEEFAEPMLESGDLPAQVIAGSVLGGRTNVGRERLRQGAGLGSPRVVGRDALK